MNHNELKGPVVITWKPFTMHPILCAGDKVFIKDG